MQKWKNSPIFIENHEHYFFVKDSVKKCLHKQLYSSIFLRYNIWKENRFVVFPT
jgi:hypothetical protein